MEVPRKLYVFLKRIHDVLYPYIGDTTIFQSLKNWFRDSIESEIESIDEEPQSVFEKGEWDNLIILDACRHDLYEEVTGKEVEYRISLGSTTMEYIERTYSDGDFSDVVYIAANPFFYGGWLKERIGNINPFHSKYDTFETDWSDEEGTVMPEPVKRDAESAKELFSNKKLIVHFIQPHYPFVGSDMGDSFSGYNSWFDGDGESTNVWELAERGEISDEDLWEAYSNNLNIVLGEAEELAENLEGRTVITSDHGNLVGEGNRYGHPNDRDFVPLRKVPWDVRK